MKKGLFTKMIATYSLIISMSFIITAVILSFWFKNYISEQKRNQVLSLVPSIEEVAKDYLADGQQDRAREKLKYLSQYSNSDILLISYYGVVAISSNDSYKNLEGTQIVTKDLEELRSGENNIIDTTNQYKDTFKNAAHTYIVPIYEGDNFEGAILINTSQQDVKEPLDKVYNRIWFSAIMAIVGSFFIIYYFSQRIIIKPLSEINNAADKISKGEVGKRVDIHSKDEIGELANSFNLMADSLEQVDRNRQRFISNVSHELRSPITSIKGFIGGILDGVIPEEKEKYYLSITYEEIQRLTRLVNDLLDLSAIESGQLTLLTGVIDINEIIRLCVIKFSTQINAKAVNVDVRFDGDNLYAIADRDRIIQVVTNLLDNAIKYVSEGGIIKIITKTRGAKVFISVFNNGPAISQEDMKHIWDRFYKADKSRTSKASTGLGLPIVRSILTQHGEDIWVENKAEEGVTFTFTLKRP